MDTEIRIQLDDLIATPTEDGQSYVCGNSGYTVRFDFSDEWDAYPYKTVRFAWTDTVTGQRRHIDRLTGAGGTVVDVPVIHDALELMIGVYAGNLKSSTPARIPCQRPITAGAAHHDVPAPSVYEQLLELLQQVVGSSTGSAPQTMRRRAYGWQTGQMATFPATRAAQPAEETAEEER